MRCMHIRKKRLHAHHTLPNGIFHENGNFNLARIPHIVCNANECKIQEGCYHNQILELESWLLSQL